MTQNALHVPKIKKEGLEKKKSLSALLLIDIQPCIISSIEQVEELLTKDFSVIINDIYEEMKNNGFDKKLFYHYLKREMASVCLNIEQLKERKSHENY